MIPLMIITIQYYSSFQFYCEWDIQKIKSLDDHLDRTRKIVEKEINTEELD